MLRRDDYPIVVRVIALLPDDHTAVRVDVDGNGHLLVDDDIFAVPVPVELVRVVLDLWCRRLDQRLSVSVRRCGVSVRRCQQLSETLLIFETLLATLRIVMELPAPGRAEPLSRSATSVVVAGLEWFTAPL